MLKQQGRTIGKGGGIYRICFKARVDLIMVYLFSAVPERLILNSAIDFKVGVEVAEAWIR